MPAVSSSPPAMTTLYVNGEPREFRGGETLTQLIETLPLAGKRYAVERNGEVVPRSQYALTPLHAGDRLEIVVAVGGG